MNKALLKFSPLEHAYSQKFGIMPDRHIEKLLSDRCEKYNKNKNSCINCESRPCKYSKECGAIINANIREVWQDQKEFRKEFHIARSTPFKGV